MMKLRAKKFLRSNNSKATKNKSSSKGVEKENSNSASTNNYEIEWEVRPGGMLVQKRSESCGIDSDGKEMITIKIFNVSQWHDISIEATSTFGDLKKLNSLVTGLHPRDQRVLYKGKERKDEEHLHLVGAGDKEKMLLLEDPTNIREKKLRTFLGGGYQTLHIHFRRTIIL